MGIQLEESQQQAVSAIEAWFKSSSSPQRFVLAGLAGTGKTTIVKYIISELNLEDQRRLLCFHRKGRYGPKSKRNPCHHNAQANVRRQRRQGNS